MSRYIDADMLLRILETDEEYNKDNPQRVDGIIDAVQEIIAMPTADVVKVVRCQDCRYWDNRFDVMVCNLTDGMKGASDFCSYGERREDDIH